MSRPGLALAGVLALVPGAARAQDHHHAGHPHASAPGAHAAAADITDAAAVGPPAVQATPADPPAHPGHAAHTATAGAAAGHALPQGRPLQPVPVPTDADRAAAFPPLARAHAHGTGVHSLVRFDRFEAWDADPGHGQAWEGRAWIGGDVQRLWLRSEGEREHGHTAADLEILYGRGIGPWWDLLAGVRHDFGPGPSRDWLAVGLQGMAPYKFEISATAYLGEHGHSALRAEVEYELLLGSRLVLQPLLEAELNGRRDPRRGLGSGLSSAGAGLRLRYELDRRFAPYLGVVHERRFGSTAGYRRLAGEEPRETRWVAGVRWWF